MPPQVFIGASSKDYTLAQEVFDFLTAHGIEVFFSQESLRERGSSDYRKEIDAALDQAIHMVVVTSSAENVRSTWLEYEWGTFANEKRSGRKPGGNLLTVVAGTMTLNDLPLGLRTYEVVPFAQLERVLLNYVGGSKGQVESSNLVPGEADDAAARATSEGLWSKSGEGASAEETLGSLFAGVVVAALIIGGAWMLKGRAPWDSQNTFDPKAVSSFTEHQLSGLGTVAVPPLNVSVSLARKRRNSPDWFIIALNQGPGPEKVSVVVTDIRRMNETLKEFVTTKDVYGDAVVFRESELEALTLHPGAATAVGAVDYVAGERLSVRSGTALPPELYHLNTPGLWQISYRVTTSVIRTVGGQFCLAWRLGAPPEPSACELH